MFYDFWEVSKKGIRALLQDNESLGMNDEVWSGEDGSYFVGDIEEISGEDFPAFKEAGKVSEYRDL